MYYGRQELIGFAKESIDKMLSYNVRRREAYAYLTNRVDLMDTSYELQCCIFDVDPIEYIRECDKLTEQKKCSWQKKGCV
jgi:hypothetical protein